jgi:hypothetical protein
MLTRGMLSVQRAYRQELISKLGARMDA